MDWQSALDRYQRDLLWIATAMFVMIGSDGKTPVPTVRRSVRGAVLLILRPAEAALRRLIVVKAFLMRQGGYVPKAARKRAAPDRPIPRGNGANRVPPFALFDPRKPFSSNKKRRGRRGPPPRISGFGDGSWRAHDAPAAAAIGPDDALNAAGLCGRLLALRRALDDLEGQARRMMRMQARRREAGESFARTEPIRRGFPPGHRTRRRHAVDDVLRDCSIWARRAEAAPDTS